MHGKGLLNFIEYNYEGDFNEGEKEGYGKYFNFETNEEYEGDFKKGMFWGFGVHYSNNK